MSESTLLVLALGVPLLAAPLIVLARHRPDVREGITLAAGLALVAVVVTLYRRFEAGHSIAIRGPELLPELRLALEVEALSLLFALVASSLWVVTSVYAIGYLRRHGEEHQTRFYACFALAIACAMGVAFSANLLTLFVGYELLTLTTYPLVTHTGSEAARRAGRVYLGILLGTSIAFLLLAIVGTWVLAGTLDFTPGGLFPASVDSPVLGVLLGLYVFGIGKAALMPFHRWLPAAMVAPTPVSALLHAVAVVKAGVFAVLKVCTFVFGFDLLNTLGSTQFLLYAGASTVLLASLVALCQDNLKARLAYSTVSQLAYITIGGLLANGAGLVGGSMHIATHALGKITLFFCAGAILVSSHKTEVSQMRGLGRQMPLTMAAFLVASLSIIGLPPLAGTWSKWYLLLGSLDAGQWLLMVVLMLSSLLSMAYLLPIPLLAFLAPAPVSASAPGGEAPWPCLAALLLTALGCLLLFLWPDALYRLASAIQTNPPTDPR